MNNSNMKIFFGTPVWTFHIENSRHVNDRLRSLISAEQTSDKGVHISNRGGWQSHGKLHQKDSFRFFTDIVNSKLKFAGKDYGFGQSTENMEITAMWANVNRLGNSNALHSHQSPAGQPNQIILSGAYYVKVPQHSGKFFFEDFGRPLRHLQLPFEHPNPVNSFTVQIPPKEGLMLMFPAWMEHGVEESKNTEERISIAFNITLIAHKIRSKTPPLVGGKRY